MSTIIDSFNYYTRYYGKSAHHFWEHMTPMQYGWILISVAAFGWMLMRSGLKR
ncbi:MAG: hypothetical protein KDA69_17555 [Planctomycetaceae bacterium]|nr:hypothetical protein [Planctomycetaceae bacterium]MCA9030302.1 hypothetical protein [Planctomycetaceae bacterium]MCA9046139.1 hypothetical protein [Planctomycetaceae bacterium]MCB9951869.1 hypothetical protein [Planctomycetaceae bacterium]